MRLMLTPMRGRGFSNPPRYLSGSQGIPYWALGRISYQAREICQPNRQLSKPIMGPQSPRSAGLTPLRLSTATWLNAGIAGAFRLGAHQLAPSATVRFQIIRRSWLHTVGSEDRVDFQYLRT